MQLDFLESKDGSKTFSADGLFYHSSYSPLKEAQRFVDSCEFLIKPKVIFLLEPGLNYFAENFHHRFPACKVVCVRFFDYAFEDEKSWDYLIRFEKEEAVARGLLEAFGEEDLLCSTLLIWKPAESLFAQQIQAFIDCYRQTLETCKTLLVTRQFFEQKWLINSCNFIKYAENLCQPFNKTKLPLVVCASGPSLQGCLTTIKSFNNKIFILCLSSALPVLIKNEIIPDLILTTDGGYWAGQHIKYLKKNPGIGLAAPCEAFIPKTILQGSPILALKYNDSSSFIGLEILKDAGIKAQEAVRNPTVSGTALYLAKALTDNKIFFCGLDLAQGKGFQHSQPNELEKNNEVYDSRLNTKESRIGRSRYNSSSLDIYRNWFISLDKAQTENIYRVLDKESQEALGNINDICPLDFNNELKKLCGVEKNISFEKQAASKDRLGAAFNYIINELKSPEWSRQIFPADYLSIEKAEDKEKEALQERLNKKIEKLTAKIRKIADE